MRDYKFGNLICSLRIERGMSQFQLGKLLGVSDKAVSKWENGNAKPRISTCHRLADILGVSLDDLLAGSSGEDRSQDEAEDGTDATLYPEDGTMTDKKKYERTDTSVQKRIELHMKTKMSMSDGIADVCFLSDRTVEWGMPAVAVTDYCSTRSFPFIERHIQNKPQKIIYGCECFMIPHADVSVEEGCHVMFLARNREGLVHLNYLISQSYTKYFAGIPRIPKELIQQYRKGLLVGSSCEHGEINDLLQNGASWDELMTCTGFYDYIEVQPFENELSSNENPREEHRDEYEKRVRDTIRLGKELDKPVVAVSNGRYLDPEDGLSRAILQYMDGMENPEYQPAYYLRTTEEMKEAFTFLGADEAEKIVVGASQFLAGMVEDRVSLYPPEIRDDGSGYPVIPEAENHMRSVVMKRAHELYGEDLPGQVTERLNKEFTLMSNPSNWTILEIAYLAVSCSHKEGYYVGTRGGVGSSFLAYLAGISDVNPLPPHYVCRSCHHTLFEKPLKSDCGTDLPDKACPCCGRMMSRDGFNIPVETFLGADGERRMDIVLNFSVDMQEKVHEFITSYFGTDRVFHPGIVSGLSGNKAEKYAEQFARDHRMETCSQDLLHSSEQITSVIRHTGQKTGSLFVLPKSYSIHDFTPVEDMDRDSSRSIPATHYDSYLLCEKLLKMDFLGHDTPTLMKQMQELSGVAMDAIPLLDPGVLNMLNSPDVLGVREEEILTPTGFTGIWALEREQAQQILHKVNPHTFEDLIRICALFTGTGVWTDNVEKLIDNGIAEAYQCPATRDDITNYLVLCGMNIGTAFEISELVRKGKGIEPTMRKAMLDVGVPEWYIRSCEKIKYIFPRAHVVNYVKDYMRLAWYKLYQPEAFYDSWFAVHSDDLETTDYSLDIHHLRRTILSIRVELQGQETIPLSEECCMKRNRETALRMLLEMKTRRFSLEKSSNFEV